MKLLIMHFSSTTYHFITARIMWISYMKKYEILEGIYNDTFRFINILKLYIFEEMSDLCGDEIDLLLLGEM
jgi:hypothetical protein